MGSTLQSLFHGNMMDICAFGKEKRLSLAWKVYIRLPSKVNFNASCIGVWNAPVISAVATFQPKYVVQSEEAVMLDDDLQMSSKSNPQKFLSPCEDSIEMDERERSRRMKISKANKGNVPWNKGRKHSAETLRRIRERTKLAMQDPKIKMKLANLGHPQSEETKMKIGVGVRMGWQRRRKWLMVQETCHLDWQNLIAEASRKGYAGEDELEWDSYRILDIQLQHEWLESIEKRKSMPRPKGSKRAPKSPEQRKKISEAIFAKWADPEYRDRVCSALAKYHGTPVGAERKSRRKPSGEALSATKKPAMKRTTKQNNIIGTERKSLRSVRPRQIKKIAPSYKDPQADSKLEMIKKIREQRTVMETKKREATERAKLLTAQAEKAAKTLETVAMKSSLARASLLETRKLIAEANQWIDSIETGQFTSCDNNKSISFISNGSVKHIDENMDNTTNANSILDKGEVNGTHLLSLSNDGNYGDLSLDKCTLKRLPNGKEPMPITHNTKIISGEGISDCGSPPSQLNGTAHLQGNLPLPNGAAKSMGEKIGVDMRLEGKSSSATKTKKRWICGRLVDAVED